MSSIKDKVSGRIKQAVGALTGDEKLKKAGRRDERAAHIKEKVDEAIDVVRDKVKDTTETFSSNERSE